MLLARQPPQEAGVTPRRSRGIIELANLPYEAEKDRPWIRFTQSYCGAPNG